MSTPAQLRIKPGVSIIGLHPAMHTAQIAACGVWGSHGFSECWITSGTEGSHSWGSRHYSGMAIDFRTVKLDKGYNWRQVKDDLAKYLGDEFDVVLENTHIHVEFHPKNGAAV